MTEETPDERMRRLLTGQYTKQLPRKFYKTVEVSDSKVILLDGKPVKTPMKNALSLPTGKLAEAVAAEWLLQDKVIDPETMPLTKLANTALDRATSERENIINEIVEYAGSDLVCYWADRPPELVQLQRQHWQPILDWANQTLNANFKHANGITHIQQDGTGLAAVRAHAELLGPWPLTGVYVLMTLTGSSLAALMLHTNATTSDSIWAATHVDENYQISQWGEDHEAIKRRKIRKREFDGLVGFLAMLK
jgi:chaperone required for assembly of F1-ATPase